MSLNHKASTSTIAESIDYHRNGNQQIRSKLRVASHVDPRTGRRTRRSFSLHSAHEEGDGDIESDENTPLLHTTIPEQDESRSRVGQAWIAVKGNATRFARFTTSDLGRSVLKCALAYLLGSMYTFIPVLANLLGRQDSKHVAATVTVYFHPARTRGSMLEALVRAFTAFLYTTTLSVSSMAVSVLFTDHLHQPLIGHVIVLIVFVGGGLGFVGWVKLTRGDPLINIACSLTALSLISVLTSEGAVQIGDLSFRKIAQYLKLIVAGVVASSLVSFLVFPVSARQKLKKSTVAVTDALSDMLGIITSSFIAGNEAELEDQQYVMVADHQRKATAALNQNLRESRWESNVIGLEREADIHARLVQCIQRIAQSIGGLRSAAAMQFVIVRQPATFSDVPETGISTLNASIVASPDRSPTLERQSMFGPEAFGSIDARARTPRMTMASLRRSSTIFKSPLEIFELFIEHLGPSMRSLAFTMKEILDDLPFDPENNYSVENNPKFRMSLDRALELYNTDRTVALQEVYNKKDMDRNRPFEVEADWEEAAACCGHFSFSLLEVASQLKEYLSILDELEMEVEERPRGRTWTWLKFWRRQVKQENDKKKRKSTSPDADIGYLQIRNPKQKKPIFHDPNAGFEAKLSRSRRFLRRIYRLFSFLRKDDKKFAIKVGFGAVLYAAPSYIATTRPIYQHWRGEWGLLSYMLVCSMTIGASNTTGLHRFGGTLLGALLAIAAWTVSYEHAVPMAIFGFFMAYWTAYIIVGKGKGPLGRFIMLTYNLSALYAYTLSMTDDEGDGDEEDGSRQPEIWTIALHRCAAVTTGVIWGLIITRLVWPISARRKVKDGLSLLWLRMGLIWRRDPLSIFLDSQNGVVGTQPRYMNLQEETELQRFLSRLQALVETSRTEFSLRRPFPAEVYVRILRCTSRMLEAFHTMAFIITKDTNASEGESAILQATFRERAQLCSRLSHQFSVLASSMKLEYSIASDALPNTAHTRDRLLARIFAYRKEDAEAPKTADEDYSLLYAYALVTGQIALEIENCLREVESLFGVLDEESLYLQ